MPVPPVTVVANCALLTGWPTEFVTRTCSGTVEPGSAGGGVPDRFVMFEAGGGCTVTFTVTLCGGEDVPLGLVAVTV